MKDKEKNKSNIEINSQKEILATLKTISKNFETLNYNIKIRNELYFKNNNNNTSFIISFLAIFISFMTLLITALPTSPKVYYETDFDICEKNINSWENLNSFYVSLTNTGNPTNFNFYIEGNNIEIEVNDDSRNIVPDYHMNSNILDGWSSRFEIMPNSSSLNEIKNLNFKFGYNYKLNLLGFIPFIKYSKSYEIGSCTYEKYFNRTENNYKLRLI